MAVLLWGLVHSGYLWLYGFSSGFGDELGRGVHGLGLRTSLV